MTFDEIDRRILHELQHDGALSNVELARRVHLSPSPCLARVKALESAGVIQRYVALADAKALGLGLNVFINISLKTQSKQALADFVLGDRDGSTCEPGFMAVVEQSLLGKGYTVARNDPYKGVALLADIGKPKLNRHSLQIEIRRPLYMDEPTRERHAGFNRLQNDLSLVLRDIAAYVRTRMASEAEGGNGKAVL